MFNIADCKNCEWYNRDEIGEFNWFGFNIKIDINKQKYITTSLFDYISHLFIVLVVGVTIGIIVASQYIRYVDKLNYDIFEDKYNTIVNGGYTDPSDLNDPWSIDYGHGYIAHKYYILNKLDYGKIHAEYYNKSIGVGTNYYYTSDSASIRLSESEFFEQVDKFSKE